MPESLHASNVRKTSEPKIVPDYINLFTETDEYDFRTLLDSCK